MTLSEESQIYIAGESYQTMFTFYYSIFVVLSMPHTLGINTELLSLI